MSFDFANPAEGELFMQLKGFIKTNNGFFKSLKQAQFLFKRFSVANIHTAEQAMRYFGVPLVDNQVCVTATAHVRWANYGARSIIPVLYVFVVDKFGVAAQYRVGGNGNLRDGWGPNPEKCKIEWTRDAGAVCPFTFPTEEEVAAKKATEPVSAWLGSVGEKITVTGAKLVSAKEMGHSRFGPMFLSTFVDTAGNIIKVWKQLSVNVGDTVNMNGTIKATDEYRGNKETTMIRVKLF